MKYNEKRAKKLATRFFAIVRTCCEEIYRAKLIAFLGKKLSSNLDLKKRSRIGVRVFLKLLLIGWGGHTMINCAKKLWSKGIDGLNMKKN